VSSCVARCWVRVCTAVRPTAFSQYSETHSTTRCLFFPHFHNTSLLIPSMYKHTASCTPTEWPTSTCCVPYGCNLATDSRNSLHCIASLSPNILLESSWNVMAPTDARERKWRGKWQMEWVASTLHITSEHSVSSITRVQLKCDGRRWRTGGEVKGKMANAVGIQYSSHYLGTWCIQHY
jgi:hypothetical protein